MALRRTVVNVVVALTVGLLLIAFLGFASAVVSVANGNHEVSDKARLLARGLVEVAKCWPLYPVLAAPLALILLLWVVGRRKRSRS